MCRAMEEIRKDDQKRNDMKNNVQHIRYMVADLGITVEKAMDVIRIPQQMRTDVVQLVKSDYYR